MCVRVVASGSGWVLGVWLGACGMGVMVRCLWGVVWLSACGVGVWAGGVWLGVCGVGVWLGLWGVGVGWVWLGSVGCVCD